MSKAERMKLETADITEENIEKIGALFPNCLTEAKDEQGRLRRAIDFDKLRQELSHEVVEGADERYRFDWPEKRKATLLANTPTNMTLRPCREESVNFDTTQNLYIEGDNLEVLKLLRENYYKQVKMIYIDPPYNTGKDSFVYDDDFRKSAEEFSDESDATDEEGNKMFDFRQNNESNGRFHTDWLNMMYPRLKVAKDLLRDDGVVFISIDDNEVENLRKICDEVFGESNFVAQLVWKKKYTGGKGTSTFVDYHEYILVYAKSIDNLGDVTMCRPEDEKAKFDQEDEYLAERGRYYTRPLKSNLDPRPTLVYPIKLPNGKEVTTQWICARETYDKLLNEGRIEFKDADRSKYPVYKKFYENDAGGRVKIPSFLEVSSNNDAKEELKTVFLMSQTRDLPFQTPKPTDLLRVFTDNFSIGDDLIMDFFSGSSSTAHAVFRSNSNDGGKRKFIMVQLPEPCDEKSEAAKAGYKNICEIGKERIRRAGKKILEENATITPNLDIGFRVLKLDSSNMRDVYYNPKEFALRQEDLLNSGDASLAENIKGDRTGEDLLFDAMLRFGISLSAKIAAEEIHGKKVFTVEDGLLMATFDKDLNEEVITEIAKRKPVRFVMCDGGFATDNVADNFEQIWQEFSPDTNRKVI